MQAAASWRAALARKALGLLAVAAAGLVVAAPLRLWWGWPYADAVGTVGFVIVAVGALAAYGSFSHRSFTLNYALSTTMSGLDRSRLALRNSIEAMGFGALLVVAGFALMLAGLAFR